MTETTNVVDLERLVPFTIDGDAYRTADLNQRAYALLRLAGRDPAAFDLGEIEGRDGQHTKRYRDDEIVSIREDARFVSIRQSATVA